MKTERLVFENQTETFFSMALRHFSVEALIWVLRSISLDKMEPNHVLIMSRMKEAFGIKMNQEEFLKFSKALCQTPSLL